MIEILVMGIVATLATDLWQRLLQATARLPPANWGLIGRWVAWFPRGVFVHRPISATASVRGELIIGWVFHYAVGIVYAGLYLAIMRLGSGQPSFLPSPSVSYFLWRRGSSCNPHSGWDSWRRIRRSQLSFES